MKSLICIILLLVVPGVCLSQSKADSLKFLLKQSLAENNKDQAAYLTSYLGYYFFSEREYDSALTYYYHFLRIRPKESKNEWLASALNGIGASYSQTGYTDSASTYYNEALRIAEQLSDTTQAIDIESNLAIIYKDVGLYDRALESSFHVLSRLEHKKPDRALASCYNTIALSYEKTGDLLEALDYHRKALIIRRKIGYKKGEAQSFNNIGETFKSLSMYDSALANLNKALALKKEIGDVKSSGSTMNNIGDLFLDKDDINQARLYFQESIKSKRAANDRIGLVVSMNNMGKISIREKNFKEAKRWLDEAEKLARETRTLDLLRQNLELSIQAKRQAGDYNGAFILTTELFAIKDSLLNSEKAKTMRSLSIQYETEQKEQKIALLEQSNILSQAQIKTRLIQIRALIGGTILLVIICIIVFMYYRMVKQNKERVETLLKELHHRVKNNLQMLSSILSLQSQELKDESAIQAVRSNEGRINAMALIHKKLYNDEQDRSINIKTYITELIEYLVYTYGYHDKKLMLKISIDELQIDVDKAIPLGLILNELISNAFKYAYANQHSPELMLSLRHRSSTEVQIMLGDNGDGMAKRMTGSSEASYGIKMVNTLIKELKGSYEVNNESGTRYLINIPL